MMFDPQAGRHPREGRVIRPLMLNLLLPMTDLVAPLSHLRYHRQMVDPKIEILIRTHLTPKLMRSPLSR